VKTKYIFRAETLDTQTEVVINSNDVEKVKDALCRFFAACGFEIELEDDTGNDLVQ